MNENIAKVLKLLAIGFLLMLFFHPIATVFFIVGHLGVIAGLALIYTVIRIILGMSIISFITRSGNKKDIVDT